jgi:hypothetical protein
MKTHTFKISMLVFGGFVLYSSCSKSTPTLHDKFVGSWKLRTAVIDLNNNGIQDATDTTENLDSFNDTLILNSNGSGTSSSIMGNASFTWNISSDDKYLLFTDSGAKDPIGTLIISQPGSTFVIKDTAGGIMWETFTKN